MNKYQEALDYFLNRDAGENITVTCDWSIYAEELKELVDKATGQKKHIENCKEREYINHNYCYACGQKLDWNDVNE